MGGASIQYKTIEPHWEFNGDTSNVAGKYYNINETNSNIQNNSNHNRSKKAMTTKNKSTKVDANFAKKSMTNKAIKVSPKFAKDLSDALAITKDAMGYGQPARINGKTIIAKQAKVASLGQVITPAPKSGFAGAGDALSKAAQKKVFKSTNLNTTVHPVKAAAERKAKRLAEKAEKKAKRDAEREAKKLQKKEKVAKAHVVKQEFIARGNDYVYDDIIVAGQQPKVLSATKKYIERKGFFDVRVSFEVANDGIHELYLKGKTSNLIKNWVGQFVAGYVQALND